MCDMSTEMELKAQQEVREAKEMELKAQREEREAKDDDCENMLQSGLLTLGSFFSQAWQLLPSMKSSPHNSFLIQPPCSATSELSSSKQFGQQQSFKSIPSLEAEDVSLATSSPFSEETKSLRKRRPVGRK
mmetsp:Transcript_26907/g.36954  ORF Transcript_26907/g.36954 Transcript_26907/m.36954 type:complete len:131 (+) Transcript_26907:265-657(+)